MLKMKKECAKCHVTTDKDKTAYICSYECTYCESCSQEMEHVCPQCNGELILRPKRVKSPMQVVASQLKEKLSPLSFKK